MDTETEAKIVDFIPRFFLILSILSACFLNIRSPNRKQIELTLGLIVLTSISYFVVYGLIHELKGFMLLSGALTIIYGSLLYYYWNKQEVEC